MKLASPQIKKNEIALAIFPFLNLSDNQNNQLFCQAFSMDLVTELSRSRQFHILVFNSSDNFNFSPDAIPALSAHYAIRGTFRSWEDNLVINAQLIKNLNNQLVWSDRFEGNITATLAMQEDLLREIVSSLQQQLNSDLLSQIRKKPATKLKTYEYRLHGMEELKKGSQESDLRAREYFQQAIETDPTYSLAYSGMSLTYFNEWSCQLWERWDVCRNGAYIWAKKAIELDEQNHVAAFVLGRTLLYNGQYELAEHYLRKALRLNPNDTESLVQIASCLTFLGYPKEAEKIYHKVLRLNPLQETSFYYVGVFIYIELGEYQKAVDCAAKVYNPVWVDFQGYLAAAYYYLGDFNQMKKAWQQFLQAFSQKISNDTINLEDRALRWMKDVNPYKDKTNLNAFWDFIRKSNFTIGGLGPILEDTRTEAIYTFRKEAELWVCSYNGKTVRINDAKGLADLAKLLEHANQPMHCAELMGISVFAGEEQLFDAKAKKQYQNRIKELQQELQEAELENNALRANLLQQEYDDLLQYLSKSLGLKGKVRTIDNPVEKARTAVTWRIRKAIQKIEQVHPALGKHLALSVKTGTFCTYSPEGLINWQV